jgi:TRAP-type mannitol/chloroaromatic compound transport system permease small subunit
VNALLSLARLIDALTEGVGRLVIWLVLVATLISAGNALARYALGESSNAWLEIQWYLFGAMFLLGAGYTLKHNEHVRIDFSTTGWAARAGLDRSCRRPAVPAANGAAAGLAGVADVP